MSPPPEERAGPLVHLGLGLLALSTLVLEVLLTRIYSVTMWYHFAFMAISVAMFGLAAGALIVHRFPAVARGPTLAAAGCGADPPTPRRGSPAAPLARWSALFALGAPAALVCVVQLRLGGEGWPGAAALALVWVLSAAPFVLSGVATCLALTRWPAAVHTLYAADLLGAALGCLLIWVLLPLLGGPGTVLAVAALGLGAAWCFALAPGSGAPRSGLLVASLVVAGLLGAQLVLGEVPALRLKWVKGGAERAAAHEAWSSFARVTVRPIPDGWPRGWGISPRFVPDRKVEQLLLQIDAAAGTVLTRFEGDPAAVRHLQWDVTSLAYHLRPGGHAAVVGVGGGRDVLAALTCGSRAVTGIELNGAILELLRGRYAGFTGRLERLPGVRLVHDEARSWLSRTPERFDVVQLSLIDTWAATAAGAFALAENGLYTTEAWAVFLERLAPGGLLSVSRYYAPDSPHELRRLVALAAAALRGAGVADPAPHLAVAVCPHQPTQPGVANLLLSREPLSPGDVAALERLCGELGFELLLAPGGSGPDEVLRRLARGEPPGASAYDLSPPTDDRPFFFNMLRLRDALGGRRGEGGANDPNLRAVSVLSLLLLVSGGLCLLCLGGPLLWRTERAPLRGNGDLFLLFAAIGTGFMLVEVALLQRLSLFLGHPVWGLCVVLFGFLLGGAAGSWLTPAGGRGRRAAALLLLGALLASQVAVPPLLLAARGAGTPARIGLALLTLLPLGCLMGMPFPLGMRAALARAPGLAPWLWGINGATSVTGSVLALALALELGTAATGWAGLGCYALAAAVLLRLERSAPAAPPSAGGVV